MEMGEVGKRKRKGRKGVRNEDRKDIIPHWIVMKLSHW
jgi:hypothetical protein